MTLSTKPKTSFVILEILKILIQNQVKAGEYYIGTCQGKDARHRVSTNMEILKILIQNQVKAGEYYIGTCRGKDARHRVSTNMEIMKILIQNYLQEIFLKNIHLPQNTSGTHEGCPYPNTMRAVVVGNYARSSLWFESGFSGFRGLMIMSLI